MIDGKRSSINIGRSLEDTAPALLDEFEGLKTSVEEVATDVVGRAEEPE